MALCIGGLVAGIVQRITHRYKMLQIGGLSVKIIGYGLLVKRSGPDSTARLVTAQILTGFGGSFAVVGTSVAAQASVPHQDVALVLALISLCSAIGASIGSAISVSVWSSMMPGQLRANLPASVTDEEVITYFGDITQLKSLPFDSEIRQGALVAYA